ALAKERNDSLSYLQITSPNANFHDLLILYQLFRQEELKPDWLIVAVVYDDLREHPIQKLLLDFLRPISSDINIPVNKAINHIENERIAHLDGVAKHQVVER